MVTFVPMKLKSLRVIALLVTTLLSIAACQKYEARNEIVNDGNTYFSIKQFAADQINMYARVPFSLYKLVYLDGKVDSTVVNFINIDWAPILRAFGETDISDKKFLGQYDFSVYLDSTMGTRVALYTAKNDKLLTRSLQIATDPSNDKITSIYIETAHHDFWGSETQKLLYIPLRIIQIQKSKHRLLGKDWELRTEYRFMGDNPDDSY